MSTNISKEKRERLVQKINAIKTYISSAAQDENTAQLLTYISDIEKDIKGKKYGLVFEEHREGIDELLENNLPVLTENTDLFIDNGGQMNFLIEGDNLASLKLLEKTHKGRIDLIYIDPPYNTGNKDFVYDDRFVDSNDTFRHSKWLSFMEKRLNVAKRLLSETGVIFISIDDIEQANLKVLADSIFETSNYIGTIIWQSATDNNPRQISTEHEYVICYAKSISHQGKWLLKSQKAKLIEDKYLELKDSCGSLREIQLKLRTWIKHNAEQLKGVVHYNNVDERGVYSNSSNSSNTKPGGYTFDIIHPLTHKACVKPAFGWRWTEDTFWRYEKAGDIEWGKDETTQPHVKKRIDTVMEQLKSIYYEDGRVATKQLETIFGSKKVFNNPKTINLIKMLLSFASHSNATVLDFFAGSGTTGHAVMKLNAEDGGNRKFILCTNNENNICRDVTYERIKRVIEKEDYKASLKYFKVDYLPISDKLYYEYADELLLHIRELVELENGINFNGNAEIAIVLTEKELDDFTQNIPETCKTIYVGHDVLPTEEQEKIFAKRKIKIKVIPEYYYRDLEG